jgi:hypothetical protein
MGARYKRYRLAVGGREFEIDTEPHGQERFIVRMRAPRIPSMSARVAIGYINGARRNWTAEFFGKRPSVPTKTARAACQVLANWALTQPAFREQQHA